MLSITSAYAAAQTQSFMGLSSSAACDSKASLKSQRCHHIQCFEFECMQMLAFYNPTELFLLWEKNTHDLSSVFWSEARSWQVQWSSYLLKGIIHPNINILSSFIHPQNISNLSKTFFNLQNTKEDIFKSVNNQSTHWPSLTSIEHKIRDISQYIFLCVPQTKQYLYFLD